jgi:hypothetical protein
MAEKEQLRMENVRSEQSLARLTSENANRNNNSEF